VLRIYINYKKILEMAEAQVVDLEIPRSSRGGGTNKNNDLNINPIWRGVYKYALPAPCHRFGGNERLSEAPPSFARPSFAPPSFWSPCAIQRLRAAPRSALRLGQWFER
jgi:hypothetical protein